MSVCFKQSSNVLSAVLYQINLKIVIVFIIFKLKPEILDNFVLFLWFTA